MRDRAARGDPGGGEIPMRQNYSEGLEMDKRAENNTSFAYSVNLLRMLLKMGLITDDEYGKIVKISAEHYGTEIICV